MGQFFKNTDKYTIIPLIFSVIITLTSAGYFVYYYPLLPLRLPLLYSLSWGQSQLVSKQQFFILPTLSILITIVNLFISSQIHSSRFVIKRILTGSLIVLNLILFISAVRIILIFI